MRASRASRGRRAALILVAVVGLSAGHAVPVAAQASWRIQAAWVDDAVLGTLVGWEVRQPIGSVPPRPAEGPRIIATRNWMLTGMVGAGINFNGPRSRGVEGLIYGHAGVLRRLGGGLEPRVGVVATGYGPAGVFGPAARIELLDVAVVQAGWLFEGGLMVGVEVAGEFVCDLVCP